MLVLVGTVAHGIAPLNHAVVRIGGLQTFAAVLIPGHRAISHYVHPNVTRQRWRGPDLSGGPLVTASRSFLRTMPPAETSPLSRSEVHSYTAPIRRSPNNMQANVRNQMYLVSESMRLMPNYCPS